jgi:hypothetical protein
MCQSAHALHSFSLHNSKLCFSFILSCLSQAPCSRECGKSEPLCNISFSFFGPSAQTFGPPLVACPRLLIQYIRNYPPYLEAVFSACKAAFPPVQLRSLRHASTQEDSQTIKRKHAPAAGKRQIHTRISRSESGRHALPCVYPLRTHFAHGSPLAYCCPYACVTLHA